MTPNLPEVALYATLVLSSFGGVVALVLTAIERFQARGAGRYDRIQMPARESMVRWAHSLALVAPNTSASTSASASAPARQVVDQAVKPAAEVDLEIEVEVEVEALAA